MCSMSFHRKTQSTMLGLLSTRCALGVTVHRGAAVRDGLDDHHRPRSGGGTWVVAVLWRAAARKWCHAVVAAAEAAFSSVMRGTPAAAYVFISNVHVVLASEFS